MTYTDEEKKLLEKLASDILDGFVGMISLPPEDQQYGKK